MAKLLASQSQYAGQNILRIGLCQGLFRYTMVPLEETLEGFFPVVVASAYGFTFGDVEI